MAPKDTQIGQDTRIRRRHEDPWLIAVFDDEQRALSAALQAAQTGIDPRSIQIGEDADAMIEPPTPSAAVSRGGTVAGIAIGMVSGAIVGVPVAFLALAGLGAAPQIAIVAVCVALGGAIVAFVAGAFAIEHADGASPALHGVTLAMPDTEPARAVLLRAAPARIDLALEETTLRSA